MSHSPVVVWFRKDLRLDDNAAFGAAVASGHPVCPVYIHDGAPTVGRALGAASRWWLHHALEDLSAQLAGRGLTLYFFCGNTGSILKNLLPSSHKIYCNHTYEPGEEEFLKSLGDRIEVFHSGVLFSPITAKPYQVFTPFYKYCLTQKLPQPCRLPSGRFLPAEAPAGAVKLNALELLPKKEWAKGFVQYWTSTRAWALDRLKNFASNTQDAGYKDRRDFVAEDATSRLSPYLAWGQIGPAEVAAAVPHAGAFLRQIFWREFAIHTLYHNPHTARGFPLRLEWKKFPWQENDKFLTAWQRGKTGHPLVDAGMRQLWSLGWMHNRARMVAASFLVKHCLVPWTDGEAWFWDTLVDADLANNVFGWQWVAGCGADAAPYFRVFNPSLQKERFDAQEKYCSRWIPELNTLQYPQPIVSNEAGRGAALTAYEEFKKSLKIIN